jgi:hypothetical protein
MSKGYCQLLSIPDKDGVSSNSDPPGSSTTSGSLNGELFKRQRIGTQLACKTCRKRKVQVRCINIDFIIIFVSVLITRVMEESLIARLSTTRCIRVMCLRQKPHLGLDEQRDISNSWPLRRYEARNGELGDPYSTYSRLSQRPRHNLLHNATENKSNTTYF